ncbi:MAG: diguanylate cyclase [Thermodesulfovibrio sp.]|nr:diguanylate cyclase [Thermodesulfovibrio sp.]
MFSKLHRIINKVKELNIFTGLIILIALPLLGLIDLSVEKFYEQFSQFKQANKIENLTNLNVVLDNFIHFLQRERGMSHLFIGKADDKTKEELLLTQRDTDKALESLKKWKEYMIKKDYDLKDLEDLLRKTEKINQIRAHVLQKNIDLSEVFNFYTEIIDTLTKYRYNIIRLIDDSEVIKILYFHLIICELKEKFGQERAVVSFFIFADSNQKQKIINRLNRIIHSQHTIEELFFKIADKQSKEYYINTVKNMNFEQMRKFYMTDNPKIEENWWEIATLRMDYLGFIQQNNINKILEISQKIKKNSQKELFISSVQLFATFILTLLIVIRFKNHIEKQIFHDILTELPNRRFLKKYLPFILNQAERYSKPFSILILDIDDFKRINDTYGHHIGDILLQKLAKVIKKNLRKSDLPVRIGGEEFLIILPNTNIEDTVKVSDRIRKAFSEIEIEINGERVNTTLSGGIASYEKGLDFDTIYKRADIALYRAKSLGKNRIEVYELNSTGGQS